MQYTDIETLYECFKRSKGVVTDSRKCVPGTIFFALKGANFDGNDFAVKALNLGCIYAVVDRDDFQDDRRLLLVDDVLRTLQALANWHRRQFEIPVLAITGTNGKTTTKELINAALGTKYSVLCTEGNLNNQIGVPLTLLRMNRNHQYAVIEMGASHPGDIDELCRIAEPTEGLITNVGKAHLQGFGSFEGVIETKTELYRYLVQHKGLIYINNEDKILMSKLDSEARIAIYKRDFELADCGQMMGFMYKRERYVTHMFGEHNINNVRAALCVATRNMVAEEDALKAICAYVPDNKRSQIVTTKSNTLIVDAYNANPTSMSAAVWQFNNNRHFQNKSVILGDMLELGEASRVEHRTMIEWLKNMDFYSIYLVGNEFCEAMHEVQLGGRDKGRFQTFRDTQELMKHLEKEPMRQRTILIKGSRGIALERIIPMV